MLGCKKKVRFTLKADILTADNRLVGVSSPPGPTNKINELE
jgi:hypothetical protein